MIQFVASNRRSICWNSETSKFLERGMDVTDHELLTRELRRREAYLAEAQRLSHTGSFGGTFPPGRSSGLTKLSVFLNSPFLESFIANDFGARSSAGYAFGENGNCRCYQRRRN
jgi:hypothetical protein